MRGKPYASLAVLAIGLAGCATGDIVLDEPGAAYVQDVAARVAGIDWSEAQAITVSLSEYQFEPASLTFQVGLPYRILFRNAGQRRHTFVAEGFFEAIAADRLVFTDGEIASPYLKTIEVLPGTAKELYFVPAKKGVYLLRCSVFLHQGFGMEGRITIE